MGGQIAGPLLDTAAQGARILLVAAGGGLDTVTRHLVHPQTLLRAERPRHARSVREARAVSGARAVTGVRCKGHQYTAYCGRWAVRRESSMGVL